MNKDILKIFATFTTWRRCFPVNFAKPFKLTSHGMLNYFRSADPLKIFSQFIMSIFIFLDQ